MPKPFLTLIFALFTFAALSQKKSDTTIFFVRYPSQIVQKAEDANYVVYVLPPDKQIDSNLYIVKGYYPDGKLMFMTSSIDNSNIVYQGSFIGFYPNRKKMVFKQYDKGAVTGQVITYYPNGKVYTIINCAPDKPDLLTECSDSTGLKLTINGDGRWVKFSDDFSKIIDEGMVKDSLPNGEWRHQKNDSTNVVSIYKNGTQKSSAEIYRSGRVVYQISEIVPEFPGGLDKFYKFLGRNIVYPDEARRRNTQGRVIVQFIVESDGSLSHVTVVRGIGVGCDAEALRVINASPKWKAGMQDGKPVATQYTVPIAFSLRN